jgi:hypothetical protein
MGVRSGLGLMGTGAGLGTAIMPGIGTAIGAGLGFLGGMFIDDEEEEEQYKSPYEGMIRAEMARLRGDTKPSAQYQANRADATRVYNRSTEKINNKVGGNVAVASRLEEMAGEQLGSNLQRVSAEENARIKSVNSQIASLGLGQQQIDISNYRYANDNSGPSWAAELGEGVAGLTAGIGVTKALGASKGGGDGFIPSGEGSNGSGVNIETEMPGLFGKPPVNNIPERMPLGSEMPLGMPKPPDNSLPNGLVPRGEFSPFVQPQFTDDAYKQMSLLRNYRSPFLTAGAR